MLSTIARLRKLTQKNVVHIMIQILTAIKYCHSRRVVHRFVCCNVCRDIKPENILFAEPRLAATIKVIDFGRSKLLKRLDLNHKLTELAGSVIYFRALVILYGT